MTILNLFQSLSTIWFSGLEKYLDRIEKDDSDLIRETKLRLYISVFFFGFNE